MPALLAVENIRAGYGPIEVLKGISLEVRPGEIVALIGANGAGKTSTLMSISGCLRARSGSITLSGRDIHAQAPHEIVRQGICHSPEGRKIFPRLTVLENLQMGAFARDDKPQIQRDLDRAFELFPILKDRRTQAGGTLSGGEQQMLAVARAVMGRPRLLLLDEPSLGLAPLIVLKIFEVVRQLNAEGISILLVEQAGPHGPQASASRLRDGNRPDHDLRHCRRAVGRQACAGRVFRGLGTASLQSVPLVPRSADE